MKEESKGDTADSGSQELGLFKLSAPPGAPAARHTRKKSSASQNISPAPITPTPSPTTTPTRGALVFRHTGTPKDNITQSGAQEARLTRRKTGPAGNRLNRSPKFDLISRNDKSDEEKDDKR